MISKLSAVALASCIGGLISAVQATPAATFTTISSLVQDAAAQDGATGATLILGAEDAVFYVENIGNSNLENPIMLPSHADLIGPTVLLSLAQSGVLQAEADIAEVLPQAAQAHPLLIADVLRARSKDDQGRAQRASQLLMHVAEAATGSRWDQLVEEHLAAPVGLRHTHYPQAPSGIAAFRTAADGSIVRTTARDYARILSLYANGGSIEGDVLLDQLSLETALDGYIANEHNCTKPDLADGCNGFENTAPGLFGFVDMELGLYGVLVTPGAEQPPQKSGRIIQQLATALSSAMPAPQGLTAATARPVN